MASQHVQRYSFRAGEGELTVTLEVAATQGRGLACFLFGGTSPHVGGQVLAAPSPRVEGRQLSHCDLWTSTVPGHKDAEAASAVARELCLATDQPVSVAVGIHVDDATPAQIAQLMDNCRSVACRAAETIRFSSSGGSCRVR